MNLQEQKERDADIVKQMDGRIKKRNEFAAYMAAKYHISRQRVYQIIAKHTKGK